MKVGVASLAVQQELEATLFDLAARVATVRAALSAAITDDVDEADRLDVLEGCYRVLSDAMDPMWAAWERFDQGQMPAGVASGSSVGLASVGSSMR